jgi:hypothetical protein
MFEKWILYTFIRCIVMYVYFEFTIPLKSYSEVLIFYMLIHVVLVVPYYANNGKTFSALLPTVQKNDRHCCL